MIVTGEDKPRKNVIDLKSHVRLMSRHKRHVIVFEWFFLKSGSLKRVIAKKGHLVEET